MMEPIVTEEQIEGWRADLSRLEWEIPLLVKRKDLLARLISVAEALEGIEPPVEPEPAPPPPPPALKPVVVAKPAEPAPAPVAAKVPEPAQADDLSGLTEHQRAVAELAMDGLSFKDIAIKLEMTEANVRSLVGKLRRTKGVPIPSRPRGRRPIADEPRPQRIIAPSAPPAPAATPAPAPAPASRAAIPAPPPVKPPTATPELDFIIAWLKEDAGVQVTAADKPNRWNVGHGPKAQPNLPPEGVVNYANTIRKHAGLSPFVLESRP